MRSWKRFAAGVIAVAAFAAPGVASADHGCNGEITEAGPLYFDDRGGTENTWVYMESNDEPGLQSGGTHAVLEYSDLCDHENPDTLLY